jgi:23S rRNA pseudouridine1911/1915/1917 synthase
MTSEIQPDSQGLPQGDPLVFQPLPEDLGTRIDRFLTDRMPDYSRTRIQSLIEEGRVQRGSEPILNSNYKIRHNDPIRVLPPPPLASSIQPEDLPIQVLFEDEFLAVVFKPAGMASHPTTTKTSGTLVNALLHHLSSLSEIGGVLRPGIVHRLDRVTSGVLVVAKNQKAHELLSAQFKARTVKKTYRVLALGADPGESGEVSGKVDRHPHKRHRMIFGRSGRATLSTFERIESEGNLQGILFHPHTGRTHQIRVHLEHLGCPVVLDETYGYEPKRWPIPSLNPLLRAYPGILLHAEKLEFDHPLTQERMSWRMPPPEDYRRIWEGVFGKPPEEC